MDKEKLIEFVHNMKALVHTELRLTGAEHTAISDGFDQLLQRLQELGPMPPQAHPGRRRD